MPLTESEQRSSVGHAVVDDLRAREDARDAEAVVRAGRRGGHHRAVRVRHARRRAREVLDVAREVRVGVVDVGVQDTDLRGRRRRHERRRDDGAAGPAEGRRVEGRRHVADDVGLRLAQQAGAAEVRRERARPVAGDDVRSADLQRAGAVALGDRSRGAAGRSTDDPGRRARGRAVHVAGQPRRSGAGSGAPQPRPGLPSRARRRARRRRPPPPSPSRSRAGAYAPRASRDQRYAPVKFTVRFWTLPASSTISSRTR